MTPLVYNLTEAYIYLTINVIVERVNYLYRELIKLSEAGTDSTKNPFERRGVLLANQVCLIVSSLCFILFFVYYWWFGLTFTAKTIPFIGLLCISLIGLNKFGFTTLSRLVLSVVLTIMSVVISIYAKKIYYDVTEPVDYFTYRFVILVCSVFPVVLFSFRERQLFWTTLINFSILMLYDPLHEAFGVGYIVNQKVGYYHFVNIVAFIAFGILLGTVLFLKKNAEKSEEENYQLIRELSDQQHEIQMQADELSISHNRLQQANDLITRQNETLASDLVERNQELSEANRELIKNNNELNQFSFTVSHNLRGPIASLLGLTQLLKMDKLDHENKEVVSHILSSIQKFDGIIRDLNTIIDIRHAIFENRQKIDLNDAVEEIRKEFQKELDEFRIRIGCNVSACPEIYSIKPMVHSILYNLISNSIKYHSPERIPEIEISAQRTEEYFVLIVRDNGIGIDLERDKQNLFKLFKRFNEHTEGRGLGLYLIKTQAEALGGRVEVESELGKYTRFTVFIKRH